MAKSVNFWLHENIKCPKNININRPYKLKRYLQPSYASWSLTQLVMDQKPWFLRSKYLVMFMDVHPSTHMRKSYVLTHPLHNALYVTKFPLQSMVYPWINAIIIHRRLSSLAINCGISWHMAPSWPIIGHHHMDQNDWP